MAKGAIPEMEVSEILDKTTFVITGKGMESVQRGSRLTILAVRGKVKNTNAPLVLPKATVEVTSHAGEYVIARPQITESDESLGGILALTMNSKRTVRRREPLQVEDDSLTGNPAHAPVKVGDPVIREEDLSEYVKLKSIEQRQ